MAWQRWARLEPHSGNKLAGSLPQWFLSMYCYSVIDNVPVCGETQWPNTEGKIYWPWWCWYFFPVSGELFSRTFSGEENKQAKHTVYSQESISLVWWLDWGWNPDGSRSWEELEIKSLQQFCNTSIWGDQIAPGSRGMAMMNLISSGNFVYMSYRGNSPKPGCCTVLL